MQPSSYPYAIGTIRRLWRAFVAGEPVDLNQLDPLVARSWLRCRALGLDPFGDLPRCAAVDELEEHRSRCEALGSIARPFMEDIFQFAGESDIVIYLTDASLYVIDALGDIELLRYIEQLGLGEGVYLREACLGTTSAAIAVHEGQPVQVVGPEHYCRQLHAFTGTAAPIYSPLGELIGVIGISTLEKLSHPHTISALMATARAIENQLHAESMLSDIHKHLDELNAALQTMRHGIIFLTANGRINHINPQAGKALGISHEKAQGRKLCDLLELPADIEAALREGKPMEQREVIFRVGNEPRPCVASVDVLREGNHLDGFVITVEQAAQARRLAQRAVGTIAHFTFDDIVGKNIRLTRVLYYARMIARSDSTVLLLGESGTGKEMFAQAIHNASQRAQGPFVSINCSAIPRELIAHELFGYEGDPQSGRAGRPSKFELADGGTIFLDNVDGLPLDVQASLVHIIDTKSIYRLNGTQAIPVDVRIIAASSDVNLLDRVQEGRFRADLFYRLHVLTLVIPPLRKRGDDVPLLIHNLVERFSRRMGKEIRISPEAMAVLQSYPWPGNIREMENVLERAMYMVEDGGRLEVEHLPRKIQEAVIGGTNEDVLTLEEAERQAIIRAGRVYRGKVTRMAEALGIGRTTLWRKMRAYGLSARSFKSWDED